VSEANEKKKSLLDAARLSIADPDFRARDPLE
jgi:hypothetical protein